MRIRPLFISSSSPSSYRRLHLPRIPPSYGRRCATSLSAPQIPLTSRNGSANAPKPPHKLRSSTVHVGTKYEHLCLSVLSRLGFSLTRIGGKSDKGIDLIGVWCAPLPPASSLPLRIIVQCKAHAGQVYPAMIRELEGAVAGSPEEWRNGETIGMLCTPKGATGGIRNAMRTAKRGIIWVTVEEGSIEGSREDGRVTQLLWNERVRKVVKDGLGSGLRYIPGAKRLEQEVVLMLDGKIWEPKLVAEKDEQSSADSISAQDTLGRVSQ